MARSFVTALLGLALAASQMGGAHPAAAASAHQTQGTLAGTITAFGNAAMHGPGNRADTFATPALLARAPAHHISNLMGPAENPPQAFTFRIDAYTGNRANATITWKWGAEGNVDSTTWVSTTAGWKLSAMQYVRPLATRQSLLTTNYLFMHDLTLGGRNLNSYATADFLRKAPHGQLINFYGFQNPFRSASARVEWISGGTARVIQIYNFGGSTVQSRIVTWGYTASGWKIVGVAGAGRG